MRTITDNAGSGAAAYVGRFAPSPTGSLHFGTLAAAVASFLHARQANGQWLVRIEDIDPPREVPGSSDQILRTLQALKLEWDGEVRYQSQHFDSYRAFADQLLADGVAYYCNCSRQQIRQLSGSSHYPGICRDRQAGPADAALRVRTTNEPVTFVDGIQGTIEYDIEARDGDFVIYRRDGLPAYHLAVVVDDADQGVSDIVRGADLLDSTPLHIYLQRLLGLHSPRYWHIPVLTDAQGDKLSKRTGASAVDARHPELAAARILSLLGLTVPTELSGAPVASLWDWAAGRINLPALKCSEIAFPESDQIGG